MLVPWKIRARLYESRNMRTALLSSEIAGKRTGAAEIVELITTTRRSAVVMTSVVMRSDNAAID